MKKKILFISLVLLLVTLLVISNTYALFETNSSGSSELDIGKWVIKVNDEDVSVSEQIDLDDFVLSQTTHTEDGYFAPGRTATFDIEIDTSGSDVSIEYELDIDDSSLQEHPNITFSVTNMNTNQVINTNPVTGVIAINDNNRVLTLRLVLTWADNVLYDEADTSLIGEELNLLINANFKQYLGE